MKNNISKLLESLPEIYKLHSRSTETYDFINSILLDLISNSELEKKDSFIVFSQFGKIKFPYIEMGSVNSINLFGLDELIIFSYYWRNRKRYKNVADIGANIGLHSIILSKCGFNVKSYEPDPLHFSILNQNLSLNDVNNVTLFNSAVSDKDGIANFVRVIGNTTSSHLKGSKDNAYGDLENISVKTINIDSVFKDTDFIKMDVEGAESLIIQSTTSDHWKKTEMILEVGSPRNASEIFNHLNKIKINSFSQKNGWQIVKTIADLPQNYKEGSLFISNNEFMNWSMS